MTLTMDKIYELIVRLEEKTQRGELDWQETAIGNQFLSSFSTYSVVIGQDDDDRVLLILNQHGDILEKVSDEDLPKRDPLAFVVMESLYQMARRQALGVDQAVDDLLGMLE